MTDGDTLADALLAARLCFIDPALGGLVLRGAGPARDAVVDLLATGMSCRKLPLAIDDDRLLGGIDLAATIAAGRNIARPGLLAEADGGMLIVPMAERIGAALASRLAAVLDTGRVQVARDGLSGDFAARVGLILLDDGHNDDERVPVVLEERLAFRFDLNRSNIGPDLESWSQELTCDRSLPDSIELPDDAVGAIARTAAALGIDSARAALFALRAARASAALFGRASVGEDDLVLAVRLVLAPRATRLPSGTPESEAEADVDPGDGGETTRPHSEPQTLDDVVLAAARAALPPDVLAMIAAGTSRQRTGASGSAGERRASLNRGRPLGARPGLPRGGARIALIDTLRAAAPWQRLRGGTGVSVRIARDDIRIKRFEARTEATTIFAVDASGSAAATRLGETKGAVELLLAEAYVRRTQVALIAFRGTAAELLLPPTRSLTRARRLLGDLPGGGATPLSAGIDAARRLAESVKARGRTPFVVLLTDGRANIAADGSQSREVAQADAERSARLLGATGIRSVFIDTGQRTRPEGAAIAVAMRASYLPLPKADAATMAGTIRALQV